MFELYLVHLITDFNSYVLERYEIFPSVVVDVQNLWNLYFISFILEQDISTELETPTSRQAIGSEKILKTGNPRGAASPHFLKTSYQLRFEWVEYTYWCWLN